MKEFYDALRRLNAHGHIEITAQLLADEIYPDSRTMNANGQVFNPASGIAGRLLRRHRGCIEVATRRWIICPELFPQQTVEALADRKEW